MQNITEMKILVLVNFGVLITKMALKIKKWHWFPSYERSLIRTSYSSADE
jgi:hypothetical protein